MLDKLHIYYVDSQGQSTIGTLEEFANELLEEIGSVAFVITRKGMKRKFDRALVDLIARKDAGKKPVNDINHVRFDPVLKKLVRR